MQTKICKVIAQSETVMVQSKKAESGQLAKCYIRLRELGGDYDDEYQCTLWGNLAQCRFAVRFETHESNGAVYQDVVARDIVPLY